MHPSFKWSQAQVYFLKLIWNMLYLCVALFKFWFQTDLRREHLASHYPLQGGKTVAFDFSHHVHALVTHYVQFLCSEWLKFGRWVHAKNLFSILKLLNFGDWSLQSFVSICEAFNCLFPLDIQNEIQTVLLFDKRQICSASCWKCEWCWQVSWVSKLKA